MSARIFRVPIEADLTTKARGLLDREQLSKVVVEFDHLDATLSGNVADRASKSRAESLVESIPGARVAYNQITYGRDLAPFLVFEDGGPVRVSGRLSRGETGRVWLEGFDASEVEFVTAAELPQFASVIRFAEQYFKSVNGGCLEIDGHRIVMAGEVATKPAKWALVDHAVGIDPDSAIEDRLVVSDPLEFDLRAGSEGGAISFEGSVRDAAQLAVLARTGDGVDLRAVTIDARVAIPRWLARVLSSVRTCFEISSAFSIELSADRIAVDGEFADQLWLEIAEQQLRLASPGSVVLDLEFSVVKRAVHDGEEAASIIPLRILVAGGRARLEGRVRTRQERETILAKIGAARPDLEIDSALKFDYREPELPEIRAALPDFLAHVVSGIAGHGFVELSDGIWRVRAACRDEEFCDRLRWLGAGIEKFAGVPTELDLHADDEPFAELAEHVLEDHAIYFTPGSAFLNGHQTEKIDGLLELLGGLGAESTITLIGCAAGDDDALALQRGRGVRRALARAGINPGRVAVRAEGADGGGGWRNDRVRIELGLGG